MLWPPDEVIDFEHRISRTMGPILEDSSRGKRSRRGDFPHSDETLEHSKRRRCDVEVIRCCSATDTTNRYRLFSNNSQEKPFMYVVPVGSERGKRILCEHATKALQCTKASIFGDEEMFKQIMDEPDPVKCQDLGRRCIKKMERIKDQIALRDWIELEWDQQLEEVAYEVLRQKFKSIKDLGTLLLHTGDDTNITAYMGSNKSFAEIGPAMALD